MRSFKNYVKIYMFTLAILPLLVVSIVFSYNYYTSSIGQAKDSIRWQIKNIATEIRQSLYRQTNVLAFFAKKKSIAGVPVELIYANLALEQLQKFTNDNPLYSAIIIVDQDGYIVEGSPITSLNINSKKIKAISEDITSDTDIDVNPKVYVVHDDTSLKILSEKGKNAYFVVAAPLMVKQDSFVNPIKITGSVIAFISFDTLLTEVSISQNSQASDKYQYLYNEESIYKQDGDIEDFIEASEKVDDFQNGETIVKSLSISVRKDRKEFTKDVKNSVIQVLAMLVLLIIVISILVQRVYRKLNDPLIRILEDSKKIENGIYDLVDSNLYYEEFDQINSSMITMAETINDHVRSLTEAKLKAESSEKLKSEFLANMSHEIRTPINGVIGMLNLISKTSLNKDQSYKLKLAKTSADSLLTLINDILDFSKIEAEKLDLEFIPFNLIDFFGDFVESMTFKAREKGIELILDTSNITYKNCIGDPGRIRQILSNIVGNAIKFTDEGEVIIKASLTYEKEKIHLYCDIVDSGIGIAEKQQKKLFSSFVQADASTTRKFGGTGLGLAISRKLAELMGGSIQLTSEEGVGSVFHIKITLEIAQDHEEIDNIQYDKNILIIEDHKSTYEAVAAQLKLFGVNCYFAKNFVDARVSILNKKIDAIFSSDKIGEYSAIDFFKKLDKDDLATTVKRVLYTSLQEEMNNQLLEQTHICFTFSKPIIYRDILSACQAAFSPENVQVIRYQHPVEQFINENKKEQIEQISKARLLLVEDNQVNQEVVLGLLEELKMHIDVAGNGAEALIALNTAIGSTPYDLVLMDCQMPEMDGFEASKKIRSGYCGKAYLNIPIIALTANAMQGDKERCIQAGMNDYLSKPIEPEVLYAMLEKWILTEDFDPIVINSLAKDSSAQDNNTTDESLPSTRDSELNTDDETLWNKETVLSRVKNKEDRLRKLVEMFVADLPERIKELKLVLHDNQYEEAIAIAHTIKGVAGTMSAKRLMTTAAQIETQIRRDQESIDASLVKQIEEVSNETIKLLQLYLES